MSSSLDQQELSGGHRLLNTDDCSPETATTVTLQTRSHPEMVGDMSHVTLNFDLSKIPFVHLAG